MGKFGNCSPPDVDAMPQLRSLTGVQRWGAGPCAPACGIDGERPGSAAGLAAGRLAGDGPGPGAHRGGVARLRAGPDAPGRPRRAERDRPPAHQAQGRPPGRGLPEDVGGGALLKAPALHADETGLRVDGRTQWLHVPGDGDLTLRFLHRRRGREAIEEIGVIPRYAGTLVHDCWKAYLTYTGCRHQLCGSHLLRELTFIVDSNGMRWARLMKTLLRLACHRVNASPTRTLTGNLRRTVRTRYRTIPGHGLRELPGIPPRPKGRRGRIAKSDAHNLHERLVRHGDSVLRFMSDPHASFTKNTGERRIRMAKSRLKVSGCFRTQFHAEAWCRIPGYLISMAAQGYNPLTAIQIALAGDAANIIREHDA